MFVQKALGFFFCKFGCLDKCLSIFMIKLVTFRKWRIIAWSTCISKTSWETNLVDYHTSRHLRSCKCCKSVHACCMEWTPCRVHKILQDLNRAPGQGILYTSYRHLNTEAYTVANWQGSEIDERVNYNILYAY